MAVACGPDSGGRILNANSSASSGKAIPEEEGDSPARRCDQGERRRRTQNVLLIARPDSVLQRPSRSFSRSL
ncbi:unnamed protein product [Arctogadus glacialis]